jgi:hypothetical protein
VVGPEEVDHLEGKCFSAVVACITKGDWQTNLPEGDGLLAWDRSIQKVQACFELVSGHCLHPSGP